MSEIFDVLVLGGGIAGITAALSVREADPGAHIALLVKGRLESPDDVAAGRRIHAGREGLCMYVPPLLSPVMAETMAHDAATIVANGGNVANPALVEAVGAEAPAIFGWLDRLGVLIDRLPNGQPAHLPDEANGPLGTIAVGRETSARIHEALVKRLHRESGIVATDRMMLVDLLPHIDGPRAPGQPSPCVGAVVMDLDTGHHTIFLARAVILATGSFAGPLSASMIPASQTGDGHAAVLRAGGACTNLEFCDWVPGLPDAPMVLAGAVFHALPRLVTNNADPDAMSASAPQPNLRLVGSYSEIAEISADAIFAKGNFPTVAVDSPGLAVDRAIFAHRGPFSGGRADSIDSNAMPVALDFSTNPSGFDDVSDAVAEWYARRDGDIRASLWRESPAVRLKLLDADLVGWFAATGYDLSSKLPLLPVVHRLRRTLGGIRIDADAATEIPQLFACGSCADMGLGAVSTAGMALLSTLATARIAGRSAAACRLTTPLPTDKMLAPRYGTAASTEPMVGELAATALMPFRADSTLDGAWKKVMGEIGAEFYRRLGSRRGSVEIVNTATVLRAAISAAQMRRDPLGTHLPDTITVSAAVSSEVPTGFCLRVTLPPDSGWTPVAPLVAPIPAAGKAHEGVGR